ncbi:MAG: CBS domain-containing protein [Thermodesulfobacteriota bacterium]
MPKQKSTASGSKELTLVITHMNADFDALASMLAAQKLYPGSLVIFPGSQEKNLKNFFIDSMAYLFNMVDIKEIDVDRLKRLVLVDTKQPGRIGKLSFLLEIPNIEIHIYDHHPRAPGDLKGDFEIHHSTGANVTILTEIIQKRRISISADEATILCLGIYEDTGSFTFSSTTERDFKAAAFLLSKGANLNTISNLISRELSPEQVGILNDMIQAATRYYFDGIEVAVTMVTANEYIPDFAFLVQKMLRMEDLNALFTIALMGNKIYVVARSKILEVDAGAILGLLGGGGHPFAASATIKDRTLTQVEHELVALLQSQIKSRRKAVDLMSSPPITVSAEFSCKDAGELLNRYNINALLVIEKPLDTVSQIDKPNLVGFITRQIIEKALYHQLGDIPVKEYMNTELVTAKPDSTLLEIQEKIIENKQRILPVVDKGNILGVITRTDLLKTLVQQSKRAAAVSPDPLLGPVSARTRNIVKFMKERISRRLLQILKNIGETAAGIGYDAFVAGGFVRDLFMYRSNEDIDIVIEGDGIDFAKKYAAAHGGRIHSHEKFGTAVTILPDGFKIDVASARLEYYKFPAALPVVEMSSIKLDLFRRDFTINTLAIALNPDRFGILIDFFSGQKDIKEKTIRVLHNMSFVEDPTRVFRAIRFEQRFGFSIGKLTLGLIENAVKMNFFQRLSGRRVFSELRQILEEENPVSAITRLHDFNLLSVIHPSIVMNQDRILLFNSVKKVLSWHDLLFLEEAYMKWAVYFLALIYQADPATTTAICSRLELPPRLTAIFTHERYHAEKCLQYLERNKPIQNSTLYLRLIGFRTELVLFMMAATESEAVKRMISNYFTQLRYIKPLIRGKDLLKMGISPGPIYREILQAILKAKLNGSLETRSEEISFVKSYNS